MMMGGVIDIEITPFNRVVNPELPMAHEIPYLAVIVHHYLEVK